MRTVIVRSILVLFLLPGFILVSSAQGFKGRVIQSVFFGDSNGEGERIISFLRLNEAAVYDSITHRFALLFKLDTISNLQDQPFVYSMGRYKEFKTMSPSEKNSVAPFPADFYFKIFLDIDMASPTLVSASLIKSKLSLEIFVFDKNFQMIKKIGGKKSSLGITSSPNNGVSEFFEVNNNEFWSMLNKILDDIYSKPT